VTEDSCDPTPRHGFSSDCAQPEQSSCVKTTIGVSGGGGRGRTRASAAIHDTRVAACAAGFIAIALMARRRSGRRGRGPAK
jgi:hypothetical protein